MNKKTQRKKYFTKMIKKKIENLKKQQINNNIHTYKYKKKEILIEREMNSVQK